MRADGDREALRLLMTGRDNAIQSCKTARTALAAVLVTAPAPLRERLCPLPRERRAKECAALTCRPARTASAIHVIAVNRMRCHPPTKAYARRRRAEGKTDREIRRCIKRYLARHLYRTLSKS